MHVGECAAIWRRDLSLTGDVVSCLAISAVMEQTSATEISAMESASEGVHRGFGPILGVR